MLTWTKNGHAWCGNGYRIERSSPRTWDLFEASSGSGELQVQVEPIPIATTTTLAECKYWAESLHGMHHLSRQRQVLAGVGVSTTLAAALCSSQPILAISFAVVAGVVALELLMTWWESWSGNAREIIQ